MKILCGEKTLDLDRMNRIRPDGEHVWAEALPFTYEPESLPDPDRGDYFLTSDRGAVSARDLAFKIMIDLCAWSGAGCGKYLLREIARGAEHADNGWDTRGIREGTAMDQLARDLGLKCVHMPDCSRTMYENLNAFYGPCDLDEAVGGMLSEYVYTRDVPFVKLHQAVSSLLSSLPPEDFVVFIEAIYGVVAHDPESVRKALGRQAQAEDQPASQEGVDGAGAGTGPDQVPEQVPGGAATDQGQAANENDAGPAETPSGTGPDGPGGDNIPPVSETGTIQVAPGGAVGPDGPSAANGMSVRDIPKGTLLPGGSGLFTTGRKLKGSDLTGTDETFTIDYYAKFYREAIDGADSEGFSDQLIKARAGEGTAPITILEEAVTKLRTAMSAKEFGPTALKGQLMDLALSIRDAAGKLEGLPEPQPAQEPDAAAPGVTDGEPVAAQDEPGSGDAGQAVQDPGETGEQPVQEDPAGAVGQPEPEAHEEPAVPESEPEAPGSEPAPDPEPDTKADDYDEEPPVPQPSDGYDEAPGSGVAVPPVFGDDDGDDGDYDPYADLGSGSGDDDGPPDSDFDEGEP